jgi:hypothetical protein
MEFACEMRARVGNESSPRNGLATPLRLVERALATAGQPEHIARVAVGLRREKAEAKGRGAGRVSSVVSLASTVEKECRGEGVWSRAPRGWSRDRERRFASPDIAVKWDPVPDAGESCNR